jgi:hypothetical protein
LLNELFSYDPKDIRPEIREQMAGLLRMRMDLLRATTEVLEYRARVWAGEAGLEDIAELKAADLARLRADHLALVIDLVKNSVNVEGLKGLFPVVLVGVLQNVNIPLPVILEAVGADLDNFKSVAESLKRLVEENL